MHFTHTLHRVFKPIFFSKLFIYFTLSAQIESLYRLTYYQAQSHNYRLSLILSMHSPLRRMHNCMTHRGGVWWASPIYTQSRSLQTQQSSSAYKESGSPKSKYSLHSASRSRTKDICRCAKLAIMIKKISPSENEFNIPAKNCHRMVILGSTKVGKTAIISRFLNKKVEDQYTPTIEDFHRKLYSIRGDVYQLDILDTSGNHPFPAMRRLSILTGKLNSERMKQTNVFM